MFKRFIVFGYWDYYPEGGIRDVVASEDTLAQALQHNHSKYDNFYIFDCGIGKIVWDNRLKDCLDIYKCMNNVETDSLLVGATYYGKKVDDMLVVPSGKQYTIDKFMKLDKIDMRNPPVCY